MDIATDSPEARKTLVMKFKQRFPNWEHQKKWSLQSGEVREITNKHLNFLNN